MKKKTNSDDLHERAEECRRNASLACDDQNAETAAAAVEEFEQGEIAKYFRENASYVTGLVVSRLKEMQADNPTYPFRPFDAETLVRLLSADTVVEYESCGLDEDLSDEETIEADETDDLIQDGWSSTATTPTSDAQDKLCNALHEYAQCAAVSAKRLASASLLDWAGILDILENKRVIYASHIAQADALRLVELHNSAADRLRLDRIIAALPSPEKSVKKVR